jgi:hypothetical protein
MSEKEEGHRRKEKKFTEKLRDFCSMPNIIRLKKSIKKGLARYVAGTQERRNI